MKKTLFNQLALIFYSWTRNFILFIDTQLNILFMDTQLYLIHRHTT